MNEFERHPLYKMMHPKSIAFWGASSNPLGMGSVQLNQLQAMRFEGDVYPIHPKETTINGLKAYKSVTDCPTPVDLGIFILPTKVVPEALEDCGRAGVKRVIIVSAGFGESGEEGKELQNRIVEIAKKHGIHFIGPNCIGVVNPYEKLNTTFFPYDAKPGFIGMASQSGSFITQMFVHLERLGLGFSQGFSVGNEAMVDITDCLEYLGECPNTKVIGLYVEAIRRGRKFVETAKRVAKKKPIVAYYVGGSEYGGKAVRSHTGAMAGADLVYDGVFKQCGIIRATSIEELFDFCMVLGTQPLPRDERIAIFTHSGGPGAAAADTADRNGLKLAQFTEDTLGKLRAIAPSTATISNPLDLTFSRSPNDYTEVLPQIVLKDENVSGMFMYMLLPLARVIQTIRSSVSEPGQAEALAEQFVDSQCKAVAALPGTFDKPVVGGTFCRTSEHFMQKLQNDSFPVLPSPERAVKGLAALVKYARLKAKLLSDEAVE